MESNDSPEIPDRWETSDIPGLPSGYQLWIRCERKWKVTSWRSNMIEESLGVSVQSGQESLLFDDIQ